MQCTECILHQHQYLAVQSRHCGLPAPKGFLYFDYEPTWWRFFQKRVTSTKLDIYVFIQHCKKYKYVLPVYLFPRSGIWAIQPLGPFLIIWFHLPVGRYPVKILSPDFSNDCSIGSWKCSLSLSLLLSLVFYSTHPQFFVRSYIS